MLSLLRRTGKCTIGGVIKKIGFFHFGCDNKGDPIGSFEAALEEAARTSSLQESLIVIPEAFNLANDYWTRAEPDAQVGRSLMEISSTRGITFVVGLIQQTPGPRSGYSCAYLIDGYTCWPLSYKTSSDESPNYQPYEGVRDEPRIHRALASRR